MRRIVLLAGISLTAFAQETTQEFDVKMQPATGAQGRGFGGSGSGECEIRVRIDQRANVDVRGSRVRVRTLQGAPSYNQGSWCTGPVPDNPSDFCFQKGSGRRNSSLSQTRIQGTAPTCTRSDSAGRAVRVAEVEGVGAGRTSGRRPDAERSTCRACG
jgi:hypothetical protein